MTLATMTLKQFDKLKHRDFSNGAVLDEIAATIKSRDALRDLILNFPGFYCTHDLKEQWAKRRNDLLPLT
jgi:hypothetical protein